MDNEIAVVDNTTAPHSLRLLKSQEEIKQENNQALSVLHEILDNKQNIVKINGKRHLEIDDWVAIGTAYGLSLRTGDAEPVEIFEAKGFKARAEIIDRNTGFVIGGAEAYCLDNEQNWLNRDYYQMASMAQTRAGSKALSNQLKGVVSLYKSLSGTPAEEMQKEAPKNNAPKPSASKPAPNKPKAPKAPVKPKLDDTAIEVEAKPVTTKAPVDESKPTFKEICDSNSTLTSIVNELQANETTINNNTVMDKLMDFWEIGTISDTEYRTAKKLLEA